MVKGHSVIFLTGVKRNVLEAGISHPLHPWYTPRRGSPKATSQPPSVRTPPPSPWHFSCTHGPETKRRKHLLLDFGAERRHAFKCTTRIYLFSLKCSVLLFENNGVIVFYISYAYTTYVRARAPHHTRLVEESSMIVQEKLSLGFQVSIPHIYLSLNRNVIPCQPRDLYTGQAVNQATLRWGPKSFIIAANGLTLPLPQNVCPSPIQRCTSPVIQQLIAETLLSATVLSKRRMVSQEDWCPHHAHEVPKISD